MIIRKTYEVKFGDVEYPHTLKLELKDGHVEYMEICGRDNTCVTMDEDEAEEFMETLEKIKAGEL